VSGRGPPKIPDSVTVPSIDQADVAAAIISRDLRVVVLGARSVEAHAIPATGKLTIGRGNDTNIRVNDSAVSRTHAIVEIVGGKVIVRDAGSSNGTKVRGKLLKSGDSSALEVGDVIEIGATTLILQRAGGVERRHRLWTHGYFEMRLDEECARARRSSGQLAVLRARVIGQTNTTSIDEQVLEALGEDCLVAVYAPGEYEALLVGAGKSGAESAAESLRKALAPLRIEIAIGIACYPADGQSAERLLDEAGARARGGGRVEPAPGDLLVIENLAMRKVYELAERIADSDINVLILGETGVGKEILARALHDRSSRKAKPFIAINCVALTESLLESELFGHEKGAFTGALAAKPGLFEAAAGGTVFLDEIGEMPLSTQAKLLRVLEERRARRVGGIQSYEIDVRFISATNRDLGLEVAKSSFRSDLYYRLNGISFLIPPLRERTDEIEALATGFAIRAMSRMGFSGKPEIAPDVLEQLRRYHWPGNVRELKNEIERAVVLARGGRIEREHVPVEKFTSSYLVAPPAPQIPPPPAATPIARAPTVPQSGSLPEQVKEMERQRIIEALEACDGNQSRAAEMLGMSRKMLMNRLDAYGIARPRKGKS
jgi:two-component system, NtrC family, response regulator AtoC